MQFFEIWSLQATLKFEIVKYNDSDKKLSKSIKVSYDQHFSSAEQQRIYNQRYNNYNELPVKLTDIKQATLFIRNDLLTICQKMK